LADKDFRTKSGIIVANTLIYAPSGGVSNQVGINTGVPDATLTVNGTANIQGNLTVTTQVTVGNSTVNTFANSTSPECRNPQCLCRS
jgi:hypothetical protein